MKKLSARGNGMVHKETVFFALLGRFRIIQHFNQTRRWLKAEASNNVDSSEVPAALTQVLNQTLQDCASLLQVFNPSRIFRVLSH